MDEYLLLFVLIVIFTFFNNKKRDTRLNDLEKKLDLLNQQINNGSAAVTQVNNNPSVLLPNIPAPVNFSASASPILVTPNEKGSAFVDWLKQDTLVKIGALLLLMSLAWFVTYAFANNWIGPVGRILIGLLFGVSILIFGTVRIRLYGSQGAIFTVVGSTIVIMTTSAAQYVYSMFPPTSALLIMFTMVVYVAFVSLQYERASLAYASLITALLAPFIINSHSGDALLLMLYLLLVVVGTLWVVWRLRAEKITLMALVGVIMYTAAVYGLDTGVALIFSFLFTGIFFITNIVSLIRRYTDWVSPIHITTALVTGLYLITSVISLSPAEWISTYLLVWALVFAYGSYVVFVRTLNKVPFYIYSATSLILLGTATAYELSGAWLTIMLTVEVLVMVMLMARVAKEHKYLNLATALFIVPGIYTLEHIGSYAWNNGLPMDDLIALVIFTAALVLVGIERSRVVDNQDDSHLLESGQRVLYSFAGIYTFVIIWLCFHSIFSDTTATMFALIIYSITGLLLYITGKMQLDSSIKTAGIVTLSFVVLRLLVVDVWSLEMTGRIITFLIIGLLFMSTAFLPKLVTNKADNK
jgi:uncharacterized membrane protein